MAKDPISILVTPEEACRVSPKAATVETLKWLNSLRAYYLNNPTGDDPRWWEIEILSAAVIAGYMQGRRDERAVQRSKEAEQDNYWVSAR